MTTPDWPLPVTAQHIGIGRTYAGPWFGVRTAPTWAFSVSTCYVTQDHPVYIPRAVQRLVRWMGIEHLIRRSVARV